MALVSNPEPPLKHQSPQNYSVVVFVHVAAVDQDKQPANDQSVEGMRRFSTLAAAGEGGTTTTCHLLLTCTICCNLQDCKG
jgi:hypothetical protein